MESDFDMLPEARRRDLQRYLARRGSASINELSRRYHVSSMTIRRDLAQLQAAGRVTLTHGGAVFNAATERRRAVPSPQSGAIARYAAGKFVNDGDALLLDGSDAALAMPPWLKEKRDLTVASNSLAVVSAVSEQLEDATILCSGGLLHAKRGGLTGPMAERFFAGFFARTAFVSADGLTLEGGLTEADVMDAGVKSGMMAAAERVIVLMESDKMGVRATVRLRAADEIKVVVTDAGVSKEMRREWTKAGIDLHVAGLD